MIHNNRLNALITIMKANHIDCTMIGPSGDLNYLTGFNPGGCERFQALFICQDKSLFYITNKLYYEDMKQALPKESTFFIWDDKQTV